MPTSFLQRDRLFDRILLTIICLLITAAVFVDYMSPDLSPDHGTYNLVMSTVVGPVDDNDIIDHHLTADDCLTAYRAHAPIVTPTSSVTFRCEYVS
jgi:hypothetical protein